MVDCRATFCMTGHVDAIMDLPSETLIICHQYSEPLEMVDPI